MSEKVEKERSVMKVKFPPNSIFCWIKVEREEIKKGQIEERKWVRERRDLNKGKIPYKKTKYFRKQMRDIFGNFYSGLVKFV